MTSCDLLVVGGGPAGLSAALVAQGDGLSVLVLEAAGVLGGQIRRADHPVTDVLGLPAKNGTLLAEGYSGHAAAAGIPIRLGARVRRIVAGPAGLVVELTKGAALGPRSVLLATGTRPRRLGVPGEALLEPGARARAEARALAGQPVVVAGGGDEASDTALRLAEAGAIVTLVVRADRLRARPSFVSALLGGPPVRILYGRRITAIEGRAQVEAVRLDDGQRLVAAACYPRLGVEVDLPEVEPPLEREADGRVRVDRAGRTSTPGVYAAGDLVLEPSERYVAMAMGTGSVAGRAIEIDLAQAERGKISG